VEGIYTMASVMFLVLHLLTLRILWLGVLLMNPSVLTAMLTVLSALVLTNANTVRLVHFYNLSLEPACSLVQ